MGGSVRYVGYARSSTSKQVSSCPRQRRSIEDFAKSRGIELAGMFEDVAISGHCTREARPGLDALLAMAEEAPVIIVVESFDRLARSEDGGRDVASAIEAGHVVRYIETCDPDGSLAASGIGKIITSMKGLFCEECWPNAERFIRALTGGRM